MLQTITSSESYIFLAVFAALALVALIYLLSPMSLLEDIATRGAEIRTRLRELLPDKYPAADTKPSCCWRTSILSWNTTKPSGSLERELNGSAFALVRPVYDAMFRALWINKVATEQEIGRAIDDKLGFDINKVVEQIKEGYFSDRPPEERELSDKVLQQLKEAWGPMCSYTHSGALAIRRRFTSDELKPNYDDAAIVEALNLATLALLLLLHMFFVSMKCPKEDAETQMLLRQYSVDFAHRVRGGQ